MSDWLRKVTALLLSALVCFMHDSAAETTLSHLYDKPQLGDATYFVESPSGRCTISPTLPAWGYKLKYHVALSSAQYSSGDQSAGCGVCLQGTYLGAGAGRNPPMEQFTALVVDECPVCGEGDIDLAENDSDGRWDISWQAIACPVGAENLAYLLQGSNPHYLKVGVRNHRVGIESVQVKTQADSPWVTAQRTVDNFFTCSTCPEPLEFPIPVKVTGANGQTIEDEIPALTNDVLLPGLKQVQFGPMKPDVKQQN